MSGIEFFIRYSIYTICIFIIGLISIFLVPTVITEFLYYILPIYDSAYTYIWTVFGCISSFSFILWSITDNFLDKIILKYGE